MRNATLLNVLVGETPAKPDLDPQSTLIVNTYVEGTLARILLLIRFGSRSESEIDLVDKFVAFLTPGGIRRKISVPINHLALEEQELDLGRCGRMFSTRLSSANERPYDEIHERARLPTCKFVFEIETGKFTTATDSEISNHLRLRIALLRLAVQPMASFNHFSVSHIAPWEEPLDDSEFVERFWGAGIAGRNETPAVRMSEDHARQVSALFGACDEIDWNSASPWRLAINRLDDAIFKIECGSTDSLLDIVIGLESVMDEAESAQESTHKVASRTARFLNDDLEGRQATFKNMKHIYGLRSKIAHGKAISLDQGGATALAAGATLLCSVLKKMLEQRRVRLDLQLLDLG